MTFREGGVSIFSRAIDVKRKDDKKLSTMLEVLPKKPKKYINGADRDIFYLNGEYGW